MIIIRAEAVSSRLHRVSGQAQLDDRISFGIPAAALRSSRTLSHPAYTGKMSDPRGAI